MNTTYTTQIGKTISAKKLTSLIKKNSVTYRVKNVNVFGSSIDELNEALIDNIVDNGYLLGDICYTIVGVQPKKRTVIVEVTARDLNDWLREYNLEERF